MAIRHTSTTDGFESLFDCLNQAGVRYVLVGGLAVVLHGYARLTADVDLVVDLAPKEAQKAINALVKLGFKPRPPVSPLEFADPKIRQSWVEDKGMMVFTMFDPANPLRVVDLFVNQPLPFEDLWRRSKILPLSHGTVRVASIEDLIRIKRKAGRPRDIEDVEPSKRFNGESLMPDKAADGKPSQQPSNWDGSWETSRHYQFSAGLAATPAQRLAWLEEALAIAYQSGALPRSK